MNVNWGRLGASKARTRVVAQSRMNGAVRRVQGASAEQGLYVRWGKEMNEAAVCSLYMLGSCCEGSGHCLSAMGELRRWLMARYCLTLVASTWTGW